MHSSIYKQRIAAGGRKHVVDAGRIQITAVRKSREEFPVEMSIAESRGPDGTIYIAYIRDISHRLAAERAGQMIDALPTAFAARVEAMADRVAQGVRAVSVRLNPDDLAVITPHLAGLEVTGTAELIADARLSRGDVEVRAEGIRLADLLEAGV